jgi:hypothetical protein
MYTRWTQNLSNPEQIKEFQEYVKGSKRLLQRLEEILDEEETAINKSETTQKSYESPNWAYLQAHKNGFRQCLRIIHTLINLDQQEHDNDPITLNRRGASRPAGPQ